MSVQAQAEFLAQRVERPIYHASSAGRDAAHQVDQPMRRLEITVCDARQRDDAEEPGEFGMHASGFDLLEFSCKS